MRRVKRDRALSYRAVGHEVGPASVVPVPIARRDGRGVRG
jgi:hypothetical protein